MKLKYKSLHSHLRQCQDTPNTSFHMLSATKKWSSLLTTDNSRMDARSIQGVGSEAFLEA
jgi:hypothetical protein